MTVVQMTNLETSFVLEGEFDLSAAAAVGATRVFGATSVTKTGAGTYVVRFGKSTNGHRVYRITNRQANLASLVVATALGARVTSVAHDVAPNADDILVTVITTNAAGAAADTTGATTVAFRVSFETRPAV